MNSHTKNAFLLVPLTALLAGAVAPLAGAIVPCNSPRDRGAVQCGISNTTTQTTAPFYMTSTVAGTATVPGYTGDGGAALGAEFKDPIQLAFDAQGNYYVVDNGNYVIRKITSTGVISTFAGTGTFGYSGDGGPATSANISNVEGIAVDSQGNVYISDTDNARVRVINSAGVISTFAGTGTHGYAGDYGPALNAVVFYPAGLNFDSHGNLYIADFGNATVREVNTSGVITPIAGDGTIAFGDFQGTNPTIGRNTAIGLPWSVAVDGSGDVFFSDIGSSRLYEVTPDDLLHTLLSGVAGSGLATDAAGDLYYADFRAGTVSKLPPGGTATLLAGDGIRGFAGDGGASLYTEFRGAYSAAFDSTGNIYVADAQNNAIRRLTPLPSNTLLIANAGSNIAWTTNSATGIPGGQQAIAPGEVVTLTGVNLGPTSSTLASPDSNGFFEKQLNGTVVTFNGTAAPILQATPTQVVAIIPYEIAGQSSVKVTVQYNGANVISATAPVTDAEPEFFTPGSAGVNGVGALNSDGSINSIGNGAAEGSTLTFFVTGEGLLNPSTPDGQVTVTGAAPVPVGTVSVTMNGSAATVTSSAEAVGLPAGFLAVTATLPAAITTTTSCSVVITVGSHTSLPIFIAVD
jgi:uncharacterized protein (TIGR03437 family)